MKAMKLRRAVAVMSVVAAAGVVPLVTAAPAHASQARCVNYLGNHGYVIGPRVRAACSYGAIFSPPATTPNPNCLLRLIEIRVSNAHAQVACSRA
ncbi:hypothetical protein [Streptomyces sp. NPDC057438]|uniref:hypothetical protein n=1 Tax=Streptomyces sp. NPDC057438 TaxID=3346133 RepID=UPI0036AEC676